VDTEAIKPWRHRYRIFPRDPKFSKKAGLVLDLYAGFGRAGDRLEGALRVGRDRGQAKRGLGYVRGHD